MLCEMLKKLATDSNKHRAKKDRRQQRSSFRDILRAVEVSSLGYTASCKNLLFKYWMPNYRRGLIIRDVYCITRVARVVIFWFISGRRWPSMQGEVWCWSYRDQLVGTKTTIRLLMSCTRHWHECTSSSKWPLLILSENHTKRCGLFLCNDSNYFT